MNQTRKRKPARASAQIKAQARKAKKAEARAAKAEGSASVTTKQVHESIKAILQLQAQITGLQRSALMSDDQFAILTRLFIMNINKVIGLQNRILDLAMAEMPEDERPPTATIDLVTYETVSKEFLLFDSLKKRSDFRELLKPWYMGEDMSNLPPEPEPEEVKEEAAEPTEAAPDGDEEEIFEDTEGHPDDADYFGGDYEETTRGDEVSGDSGQSSEEEAPDVHEVQGADVHEDGARVDREFPVVPSV